MRPTKVKLCFGLACWGKIRSITCGGFGDWETRAVDSVFVWKRVWTRTHSRNFTRWCHGHKCFCTWFSGTEKGLEERLYGPE